MNIATQDSQLRTQAIAEPQAKTATRVARASDAAPPVSSENAIPQPVAKLAACPDTPNCVSTLATDAQHAIEPMRYAGTLAAAQSAAAFAQTGAN
ncbi:MAG: DUF1499 domain-containing protein [Litorilinea sp.]